MKDLYDREIQIGDRCIRYSGWTSTLEEVIVLGEDEKGIKILNSFDKEMYTTGEKLFDFDALERQIREEVFINSVKALNVKLDDTVVVSLIKGQVPMNECKSIFDQMKKMFPNNKVSLVVGLDVSIENGSETNV